MHNPISFLKIISYGKETLIAVDHSNFVVGKDTLNRLWTCKQKKNLK